MITSHPFKLVPFAIGPETEALKIFGTASYTQEQKLVCVEMKLEGSLGRIEVPEQSQETNREVGLWEKTCFEVFCAETGRPNYEEWNFAPSGAWCSFEFDDYRRAKMGGSPPEPKAAQWTKSQFHLSLELEVPTRFEGGLKVGISAVLLHQGSLKSYWALSHPRQKPDFHHSAGFILSLS